MKPAEPRQQLYEFLLCWGVGGGRLGGLFRPFFSFFFFFLPLLSFPVCLLLTHCWELRKHIACEYPPPPHDPPQPLEPLPTAARPGDRDRDGDGTGGDQGGSAVNSAGTPRAAPELLLQGQGGVGGVVTHFCTWCSAVSWFYCFVFYRFDVLPFYHFIILLFHYFTVISSFYHFINLLCYCFAMLLFHYFTILSLHAFIIYFTILLFHNFIVISLIPYFMMSLFYYFIIPSFYYFIIPLHYYVIISLFHYIII